jgi:hypothetical protein
MPYAMRETIAGGEPADNGQTQRDTILVIGGPSSGKTVWIARLLDALRTPTTLYRGRIPDGDMWLSGSGHSTIYCDIADPETKHRLEAVIAGLGERRWPTPSSETVEYSVQFAITGDRVRVNQRTMNIVDLPGSALLSAFSPSNPSTLTVGWSVENQFSRVAAVVLLIDPVRAVEKSRESIDLNNATVAMLEHLRAAHDGRSIPLAILLSKGDRTYKIIVKEGGVRNFVNRHLHEVLRAAGSARLYISSATRSRLIAPSYREPSLRRPVENLIEPMHFLLQTFDQVEAMRERRAAAQRRSTQLEHPALESQHPSPVVSRPILVALALGLATFLFGLFSFVTKPTTDGARTETHSSPANTETPSRETPVEPLSPTETREADLFPANSGTSTLDEKSPVSSDDAASVHVESEADDVSS